MLVGGKKNLAHEMMNQNKEIGYREAPIKGQMMSVNIEWRLRNWKLWLQIRIEMLHTLTVWNNETNKKLECGE